MVGRNEMTQLVYQHLSNSIFANEIFADCNFCRTMFSRRVFDGGFANRQPARAKLFPRFSNHKIDITIVKLLGIQLLRSCFDFLEYGNNFRVSTYAFHSVCSLFIIVYQSITDNGCQQYFLLRQRWFCCRVLLSTKKSYGKEAPLY